jgi:hypothetical protein
MNMMNKMLVLTVALVLGISGVAFAGAQVLSDQSLDGVSAGDWVVLKDNQGNDTVADVYTNNNTLWLLEDSQKDVKAVSNANAIDSAIAVQTNVARVTGDTPTENVAINNANTADIKNYRPADSLATSQSNSNLVTGTSSKSLTSSTGETFALNSALVDLQSSGSSSSSSSALAWNETLDAAAAAAGSTKLIDKSGIGGGVYASSATVDYDKIITASASAASAAQAARNLSSTMGATHESSSSTVDTLETSNTALTTSEQSSNARNAKGANNHILLDATSQQAIQAVSNLNAVASGAAVQTNVVSNMGVSGTIANSNTASVQSGF